MYIVLRLLTCYKKMRELECKQNDDVSEKEEVEVAEQSFRRCRHGSHTLALLQLGH